MNDENSIWKAYKKKQRKLTPAFIAKQARIFFSKKNDKASKLLVDCKNTSEMQYRLTWLSEGSLKYHLLQINVSFGGDPEEKQLYKEFDEYLNQFS
jgi:hypothetical protein